MVIVWCQCIHLNPSGSIVPTCMVELIYVFLHFVLWDSLHSTCFIIKTNLSDFGNTKTEPAVNHYAIQCNKYYLCESYEVTFFKNTVRNDYFTVHSSVAQDCIILENFI